MNAKLNTGDPVWVVSPYTGTRERAEVIEAPERYVGWDVWVRLLDVPTPSGSPTSTGTFPPSWIEARS